MLPDHPFENHLTIGGDVERVGEEKRRQQHAAEHRHGGENATPRAPRRRPTPEALRSLGARSWPSSALIPRRSSCGERSSAARVGVAPGGVEGRIAAVHRLAADIFVAGLTSQPVTLLDEARPPWLTPPRGARIEERAPPRATWRDPAITRLPSARSPSTLRPSTYPYFTMQ